MNNTITVIDIEESGISLVTGYYLNGKEYILSARHSSPLALDPETHFFDAKQVKETLLERRNKRRESLSGGHFGATILLLPSEGFLSIDSKNGTTFVAGDRISILDYNSCNLRIRKRCENNAGASIVSVIPFLFYADRTKYKTFPLGAKARELGIDSDVHRISHTRDTYYKNRMAQVGTKPYLTFFSSYARTNYRNSINCPESYLNLDISEKECVLTYVDKGRLRMTAPINNGGLGIDYFAYSASQELKISKEYSRELLETFGFSDLDGFPYQSDDPFTVPERKKAFVKALSPIVEFLQQTKISGIPLILTGEGSKLVGIKEELSHQTGLATNVFSSPVIGAKDPCYLACLGAIHLSSYEYQPTPAEGKNTQQQYDLGKDPLKRE